MGTKAITVNSVCGAWTQKNTSNYLISGSLPKGNRSWNGNAGDCKSDIRYCSCQNQNLPLVTRFPVNTYFSGSLEGRFFRDEGLSAATREENRKKLRNSRLNCCPYAKEKCLSISNDIYIAECKTSINTQKCRNIRRPVSVDSLLDTEVQRYTRGTSKKRARMKNAVRNGQNCYEDRQQCDWEPRLIRSAAAHLDMRVRSDINRIRCLQHQLDSLRSARVAKEAKLARDALRTRAQAESISMQNHEHKGFRQNQKSAAMTKVVDSVMVSLRKSQLAVRIQALIRGYIARKIDVPWMKLHLKKRIALRHLGAAAARHLQAVAIRKNAAKEKLIYVEKKRVEAYNAATKIQSLQRGIATRVRFGRVLRNLRKAAIISLEKLAILAEIPLLSRVCKVTSSAQERIKSSIFDVRSELSQTGLALPPHDVLKQVTSTATQLQKPLSQLQMSVCELKSIRAVATLTKEVNRLNELIKTIWNTILGIDVKYSNLHGGNQDFRIRQKLVTAPWQQQKPWIPGSHLPALPRVNIRTTFPESSTYFESRPVLFTRSFGDFKRSESSLGAPKSVLESSSDHKCTNQIEIEYKSSGVFCFSSAEFQTKPPLPRSRNAEVRPKIQLDSDESNKINHLYVNSEANFKESKFLVRSCMTDTIKNLEDSAVDSTWICTSKYTIKSGTPTPKSSTSTSKSSTSTSKSSTSLSKSSASMRCLSTTGAS